jgi:2-dehydro-3-deoxyphosphogluconate aldolase/(4S)-4-hydroxy-2-oxoglutarate aldolase
MRELASSLPKDVLIGAGTVLDATTARACIAAGAEFVVGPGLDLELIKTAHEHGKAVIAGALTPTEVIQAWRAGADLVKVFPCSALGGARYLRALRGPLPNVRLVPTGGVNLHTAEAYIVAGASALGVGSELVDSEALEGGQDARLIERAREFVRTIGDARRIIGSYRKGRSQ